MESAQHPGQMPSPERIFNLLNGYQQSAALEAAIELDLFTAIGEGVETVESLASRCNAAERGIRILCDYLVIAGLLMKQESKYFLTPEAGAFLNRRSPAYLGTSVRFLRSPLLMEAFKNLSAAVRKGGTAVSADGTMEADHPVWEEFARGMAPMMAPMAELIADLVGARTAGPWKVLDIAAGHGLFGIAVARHNPSAEIFAVDWLGVLNVAVENARNAGVSERYHTVPGDAFEVDFGGGYDLVLLTNFLHHFDVATCERLLRKLHAALKEEGRVVTLEFIPNEDRVSPATSAGFALTMLASTAAGDAYTFSEFDSMFRSAGFAGSELHEPRESPQRIIISYKK